jgi:putative redox protein
MATKTSLDWKQDLTFEAKVNGYKIILDTDTQNGGNDSGPRPKPLLLAALSGCTGMDVVSILQKMKVTDFTYHIDMEADSTTEHPIVYTTIRMIHRLDGVNVPSDKVIKAVELSRDRYCGVNAMLSKAIDIKSSIIINGAEVYHD